MPYQSWAGLLNDGAPWQTTSGAALSTAATATISPQAAGSTTGRDFAVPSAYFYPQRTIRVWASGFITTTATSTTWTFFLAAVKNNDGATYVTLATTAGITTGATAATGLPWWFSGFITCTASGATGNTMSSQGRLFVQSTAAQPSLAAGTSNLLHFGLPAASGTTASAMDTTVPQGLCLRSTLAGANATVQCTNFDLEAWN